MACIGLCMIVKNEAHIIRRCLDSVRPLLDYVLVVDTGSSDGTQQVIRDFLREQNLPGELIDEPWRDFAYNRSFALQKLRERKDLDYGLMIDADEVLVYDQGFNAAQFKRGLTKAVYDVQTRYSTVVYTRPQIFSNRLDFSYKGVLHEYLDCAEPLSRAPAVGFFNRPIQDSARSRNTKKFQDDAAVLEAALLVETDPFMLSRYTFYLAQSYKDFGEQQRALQTYLRRAQQGYWQEEVYLSLLYAARLKDSLRYDAAQVIQAFMAAHESLPTRLEALHGAILYCRLNGQYQQAYILGQYALSLSAPKDGLFIEQWVNDYGLLDEFSIVAYWAGHYRESFNACLKLLKENKAPAEYRQRFTENAHYAIEKLKQPNLAKLLPAEKNGNQHESNANKLR
jgi:glycosyltransferase involved in cell wall biosynthesis